ncbi:hypothetical protein EDC96DRAFT_166465 [Choanephora cucurbitarum]|nr:hypothetical protein EDC96DRAFT_166465 [Choanephora cucurbitarum]
MSHGPSRAYPSHSYSAMSPNTMARQQVMSSPQSFQQIVASSSPNLGNMGSPSSNSNPNVVATSANAVANSPVSTRTISNRLQASKSPTSNASAAPSNSSKSTSGGALSAQDKLYCDSCQTFRSIDIFVKKDHTYNVCRICQNREMQKKKQHAERFEVFEEQQQRNKQQRFIQYTAPSSSQQQQALSPTLLNNSNNNTSNKSNLNNNNHHTSSNATTGNNTMNSHVFSPLAHSASSSNSGNNTDTSSNTPSHIKSSSTASGSNHTRHNNDKHVYTTINSMPQVQSHLPPQTMQSSISLPMPTQQQEMQQMKNEAFIHRLEKSNMMNNTQNSTNPMTSIMPATSVTSTSNALGSSVDRNGTNTITTHHKASAALERASQTVISLEAFVHELERESEFDRKTYHLNIQPLIIRLGSNPGFTQLGRAICEHVLEGTKFNFR